MKFLFYSSFLLFAFSCFPRIIQALETQFNTLNINHHLSLTLTCDRTSKAGFMRNRLEVVNRQSPCSADQWDSKQALLNISSLADILMRDQLRVNSIQARTNKLSVQSGDSLGSGEYIVAIGFGTPERRLSLILDTGSDVTWIQCRPCLKHCYPQKDRIFDPSASTTYSTIHCKSRECSELDKYQGGSGCSHRSPCVYGVEYGDGSYTTGFYSSDTLTITPTGGDLFPHFLFGCGQNNKGLFGQTAGLLGLGRTPISFVSQMAKKFRKHFSYCLPSSKSSTGFLTFGKHNNNNKKKKNRMVFTPLVPIPQGGYPYYYIEITAISVGGTRLPIKESVFTTVGAVIDSGTVITRLPPAAYKVMSTEFRRLMTSRVFKYKIAPAVSILDTCFHISKMITKVPTMSFTFKGNATLHLDPSGILYVINSTLACLAFAGNINPKVVAIFGNTQQMKFEWMYDVEGNQLGFLPNPSCL